MKSLDQLANEKTIARAILHDVFHGQSGEIVKEYVTALLDLENVVDKDTHRTYYNLGKKDALETLINEGLKHGGK